MNKQLVFLQGHFKAYHPERLGEEIKKFNKYKLIPQPDSRRTLNPRLAVNKKLNLFFSLNIVIVQNANQLMHFVNIIKNQ